MRQRTKRVAACVIAFALTSGSDAWIQAKEQLLNTEDQDAFDRAERRVRLLCNA